MKCLSTRRAVVGWIRRRYELDDGSRMTTYEVPEAVLTRMGWGGMARLNEKCQEWQRGIERHRKAVELRQAVLSQPGVKAEYVAHVLGIHPTYVRRIRQRAKGETK